MKGRERTTARLGERHFPLEAASIAEARRFVGEVLKTSPLRLVQDVQLIVSELATNCVLHAKTEFDLSISAFDDQFRVELRDGSRVSPVFHRHRGTQSGGRGMVIADTLSTEWGVEWRGSREKVVWFSVPAHDSGRGRSAEP